MELFVRWFTRTLQNTSDSVIIDSTLQATCCSNWCRLLSSSNTRRTASVLVSRASKQCMVCPSYGVGVDQISISILDSKSSWRLTRTAILYVSYWQPMCLCRHPHWRNVHIVHIHKRIRFVGLNGVPFFIFGRHLAYLRWYFRPSVGVKRTMNFASSRCKSIGRALACEYTLYIYLPSNMIYTEGAWKRPARERLSRLLILNAIQVGNTYSHAEYIRYKCICGTNNKYAHSNDHVPICYRDKVARIPSICLYVRGEPAMACIWYDALCVVCVLLGSPLFFCLLHPQNFSFCKLLCGFSIMGLQITRLR